VQRGWCVRLTASSQSPSWFSRQCGILNSSQPYMLPRPLTTIALLYLPSGFAWAVKEKRRFEGSRLMPRQVPDLPSLELGICAVVICGRFLKAHFRCSHAVVDLRVLESCELGRDLRQRPCGALLEKQWSFRCTEEGRAKLQLLSLASPLPAGMSQPV
jgi:hypothetical protein